MVVGARRQQRGAHGRALARTTERTWTAVPADTLDTFATRLCSSRAGASLRTARRDYVDIAYFLEAREGPGIFFTHSMDCAIAGAWATGYFIRRWQSCTAIIRRRSIGGSVG